MCHGWWERRLRDERRESRELWEEFEKTQPLSNPEETGEEADITLEEREARPASVER